MLVYNFVIFVFDYFIYDVGLSVLDKECNMFYIIWWNNVFFIMKKLKFLVKVCFIRDCLVKVLI